MRRRVSSVSLVALLGTALAARADVAPFPSWRLVANGAITAAVQSGDAVFVGGSFTKIGRAVVGFDAFVDPATLDLITDPGCARDGDTVLTPFDDGNPRLVPYSSRLRDAVGPFVLEPSVSFVRVMGDCRFDRRFAIRLPPNSMLAGRPLSAGARLYSVVWSALWTDAVYIVAFDGVTGALAGYWSFATPLYSDLQLVAAAPDGRLVFAGSGVGWFDPGTGRVTHARGGSWAVPLGTRLLVARTEWHGAFPMTELDLLDLSTLEPLALWPQVRFETLGVVHAAAAAGGRIAIATGGRLQIAGSASRALVGFDEVTGAFDPAWSAPSWVDDPASAVRQMVPDGSRLLMFGDFVPGAPRDTVVALDAATGVLDPWEFPFAAAGLARAGAALHLGRITSTRRAARRYLAAVAASDGSVLPWNPGATSPPESTSRVSALSADAEFVYVGSTGRVRRYASSTGERDEAWRLDLDAGSYLPEVSSVALGLDAVYVTGSFSAAKDSEAGAWQPRAGGAAMRLSGGLTPWDPRAGSRCSYWAGRIFVVYPCIAQIAISQNRTFVRGTLNFADAHRSLAALSTDSGAVDPGFPVVTVPVYSIAAAGEVVFACYRLGETRLARIEPGLRVSLLDTPAPGACDESRGSSARYDIGGVAAHGDRVYAGVERDGLTGAPTGNPITWRRPLAVVDGVVDIGNDYTLSWYAGLGRRAPGAPTDAAASLNGPAVTLRWSRAVGELEPFRPPVPGATAALSHIVLVSLTPGGPIVAQLETASPETSYTIAAPAGVYFVRVVARNQFGTSEASNEVRVEVLPSAPDPPVATVATVVGHDVRIAWQAAPQGWPTLGFALEAGTAPGRSDIGTFRVSGLAFRGVGVPSGQYYVRVLALNAQGASAPGEEVLVVVP